VGGKIELYDESPKFAMSREFLEEAGAYINPEKWILFCKYIWKDGTVYFFVLNENSEEFLSTVKTMTEENIEWVDVDALNCQSTIYNLKWLIPLALDPSLDFKKNGPIVINE
jgi:8-oxo-dGTP pyrophosphatase MutT (NUDIX family)